MSKIGLGIPHEFNECLSYKSLIWFDFLYLAHQGIFVHQYFVHDFGRFRYYVHGNTVNMAKRVTHGKDSKVDRCIYHIPDVIPRDNFVRCSNVYLSTLFSPLRYPLGAFWRPTGIKANSNCNSLSTHLRRWKHFSVMILLCRYIQLTYWPNVATPFQAAEKHVPIHRKSMLIDILLVN